MPSPREPRGFLEVSKLESAKNSGQHLMLLLDHQSRAAPLSLNCATALKGCSPGSWVNNTRRDQRSRSYIFS